MARIILHSDDLGLHPAVNRAILGCAREGLLSSASLLANGPAAAEAAAQAREIPGLGVGVHLNIVRGRPVSDPSTVPSLVDAQGRFFNSMARLVLRSKRGLLQAREIQAEYRNQVRAIQALGIVPTHFDSEKHSHLLLPDAGQALAALTAELGIKKVRRVRESPLSGPVGADVRSASLSGAVKVALLERGVRQAALPWQELVTTDYTIGVRAPVGSDHEPSRRTMERLFSLPEHLSVEWIFHLGEPADYQDLEAEFGRFRLGESRSRELEFLRSAGTRALIASNRGRVISYRGL